MHAPSLDASPVARGFSVGAVGVGDPSLVARLHENAFAYDAHGQLYADVPMRSQGAKLDETLRSWLVAATPESRATRSRWISSAPRADHLVASGPGVFEHTVDGPAPVGAVPAQTFSSWALGTTGVTRSIVLGPAVDVTLHGDGHVHASR